MPVSPDRSSRKGLIMTRSHFALVSLSVLLLLTVSVEAGPPDEATKQALDQTVAVEFIDTPLNEAAEALAKMYNVKLAIDGKSLTDVGIPTDEPMNLAVRDVTLQSALNLLLDQYGLTAIPADGGGLTITTVEVADEVSFYEHDYDLTPILSRMRVSGDDLLHTLQQGTITQWETIDGIGGTHRLQGATLAIRQSWKGHRQIESLLADITRLVNPVKAPKATAAEQRHQEVLRALKKPVGLKFAETPLREAIKQLASAAGMMILVDVVALNEEGVSVKEPVTLDGDHDSLAAELDALLNSLELTRVAEDGVIKITTLPVMHDKQTARVFDARQKIQQLGGPQPLIDGIQAIPDPDNQINWEDIDGIGGTITVLGGALIVRHHRVALDKITEFVGPAE